MSNSCKDLGAKQIQTSFGVLGDEKDEDSRELQKMTGLGKLTHGCKCEC